MFKKLGLSLFALLAAVGIAYAGGAFSQYPIINVPANTNCLSFGNNGVCNQYSPAGPTALTGNELIPADTQLPGGQNPQTILLTMASIGALPYSYVVPANASTNTISNLTGKLILDPATTLTTVTVVFPAASTLVDGQTLELSSTKTLTALVITAGAGTTVSNVPTALTISTTATYGYKFLYNAANAIWYRLN